MGNKITEKLPINCIHIRLLFVGRWPSPSHILLPKRLVSAILKFIVFPISSSVKRRKASDTFALIAVHVWVLTQASLSVGFPPASQNDSFQQN